MLIIKSMFSALSMYSRIPVPQLEWKDENRRYSLCFFPLVGVVIALLMLAWRYLCGLLNISNLLFAVGCTVIPLAVSGGIHMDGFCDVCDAKASCADREKKLAIMSDPHIGAFGVIACVCAVLLQTGAYTMLYEYEYFILAVTGFVLSRALSGLAAVTFKAAKKEGTLQAFSSPAHKAATITVLSLVVVGCVALCLVVSPLAACASIAAAAGCFIYYRLSSYRIFGGITGDTAGHFVTVSETVLPLCIALAGALIERGINI